MKEFIKISSKAQILGALNDFADVFPHLKEKIDSIDNYSDKLYRLANVYLGIECGEIFGMSVFYTNDQIDRTAYISLIGIKEKFRNRGFGKWLLEQSEKQAKYHGMKWLRLEVDLDNENAIHFYRI